MEIEEDMKKFLSEIAEEIVYLKSLGIRGTDKQKMIDIYRKEQVGFTLMVDFPP